MPAWKGVAFLPAQPGARHLGAWPPGIQQVPQTGLFPSESGPKKLHPRLDPRTDPMGSYFRGKGRPLCMCSEAPAFWGGGILDLKLSASFIPGFYLPALCSFF